MSSSSFNGGLDVVAVVLLMAVSTNEKNKRVKLFLLKRTSFAIWFISLYIGFFFSGEGYGAKVGSGNC